MKKFTTIKTLLVGLCAMGTTSAWGETITLTPSETTVIWGSGNGANGAETLNTNGDNVFYDADATSWLCSQANISGGKLNNQNAAWGGSYAVLIKFDGSSQLEGMTIQKATLSFRSVCTVSGRNSNVITSSISTNWDATTATWNNTVNDLTISQISEGTGQNVDTSAKILSEDVTAVLSEDDDNIIAFAIYTYTAREQKISEIELKVEALNASTTTSFIINYVDESDNVIKTEEGTGTIGNNPELTNDQKASFIIDDQKYIYQSDDASDVTLASDGSSVVKVVCRKAESWAYTVNGVDVDSNVLFTVKEGTVFEGEKATVAYPEYFLKEDGELVQAGKIDDNKKQYNYTFSVTENNFVTTITYSSKNIQNIIFYEEGENIAGLTPCNSANTAIRSSNSASAYASSDTKITTLEPGKYKLHAIIYDASKTPNSHWIFMAGDKQIADLNCTVVNIQELASPEFEVYYETDIIMAKMGGNTMGLDAIYIEKTGDVEIPENVTVTVTDAGYATYCSEYALDLSGVEAYTATIDDGGQVSFVSQNGVVAPGTGLLIKAEAGDVTIPVAAEGAQTIADNVLISGTTAPAGSFVLMGTPEVGFYKTTAEFTLGANTAYIAPVASEAREFIALGEATAIKAVETAEQSGEIYNLAGQRVKSAQKGLYIIGGKKVIK